MFAGLRKPTELMVIVVTLLAYGCPVQAIVHAYGLDERTVASWRDRAGNHCERVHQGLVEQGKLDLVHVQADEIRVKGRQIIAWMSLALMVSTRLWLRRFHLLLVAGALSLVVGCSILPMPPTVAATQTPSPTPPRPDAWTPLEQRPLRLPALAPGAPCPKAPGRQVNPAYGPALGDGPAYPLGFGTQGILQMYAPGSITSKYWQQWGGARTPWIIAPSYIGPILVRGGQVDGSHGMEFSGGAAPNSDYLMDPPLPELKLQGGAQTDNTGWSPWIDTYTRVQVPGCYAFQVDGLRFSATVVFQAVLP